MAVPTVQQSNPPRASSPSMPPRHRPLGRASTLADVSATPLRRRRSSMFSDTMSDTRRSLRTSVSHDLLIPRAEGTESLQDHQESSHWNSVPLGLALFPAVGGLLFQNGGAVITDVTLLALAAIFLNWSVRLPWEWYAAAQTIQPSEPGQVPLSDLIVEESDEDEESKEAAVSSRNVSPDRTKQHKPTDRTNYETQNAAQKELNAHELLALLSCFVSPIVGAWLLHAIRSQLSRPSEGLVSNYNLTVFLLAAEIRPVSHLVKMVQARTLYLQRVVASTATDEDLKASPETILDVSRRLEDLEAHIAKSADNKARETSHEVLAANAAAQVNSDIRKGLQPGLDALNRAVRRYEKRATISGLQTETRLQDLEARLNDTIALAAAAQRSLEARNSSGMVHALQVSYATLFSMPAQFCWTLLQLPSTALQWALALTQQKGATKAKNYQARPARQSKDARLRDRKGKGIA